MVCSRSSIASDVMLLLMQRESFFVGSLKFGPAAEFSESLIGISPFQGLDIGPILLTAS